jgi:biotin operon repressor
MDNIGYINPYGAFEGMFIPDWMFRTTLSANARFTYAYLARAAGPNGKCFPGQGTMARYLGISVKSVERVIAELKREGFIESRRRKNYAGSTNEYLFRDHPATRQKIKHPPDNIVGTKQEVELTPPASRVGSSSPISEGSRHSEGPSSLNNEGYSSPADEGSHIKKKVLKRNKQKIIKRETNLIKSVVRGSETEESNGTKVYPNTAAIATEIWSQGLGDRLDPYLGEDENVLFWDLCSMLSGKKSAKTPSEEEQVNAFLHVAHISVHHMFEYDLVGGAVNQTFLEKRYLDKKNRNTLLFADIALTMFKVYTGLNVDVLNVKSWESYLYNKKIKLHAGDVKSWPDFCQYVAYEINAPENTFYEDIVVKGEISFKQLSRLHKRFRDDT